MRFTLRKNKGTVVGSLLAMILLLPHYSCNPFRDYFRDPETGILTETLHTAMLTGYTASMAVAVMNGQSLSHVTLSRSNPGFPCTTLMTVDPAGATGIPFVTGQTGEILIAGLWPDASTAILTLVFSDYHASSNTFTVLAIETIPVILDEGSIHVALAGMDVSLNPDPEPLLSLNLTTLEIESELLRLSLPRPADVYVAITQEAYYIDASYFDFSAHPGEYAYTITGGGQLVAVNNQAAEIIQQALVEVEVSSDCPGNPTGGIALLKLTGVESDGFPELGTALLQCEPTCDGNARVIVATGMYVGSNGQRVPFPL